MSVVIVGAGQAGAQAALALRSAGYKDPITIVGEERHLPYERPPLSKGVLEGLMPAEKAALQPASVYASRDIRLCLGVRATAIDRANRRLLLANGEQLDYAHLVLATGLRPRMLPTTGTLDAHVFNLRTLDDAARLRPRLKAGTRVLVIGGGFLGMEIAATARQLGCTVTVTERNPSLLFRVVAAEVSAHLMGLHQARGVRVLTDTVPTELRPSASGDHAVAELSTGETLCADTVVAAIGSLPNTELAVDAGLSVQDGILTDAWCRTSDPYVFAIGDVSRHHNLTLDRLVRIESWQNAQSQAACVARSIMGEPRPCSEVPWFWTDQFNWNLQILGCPLTWDQLVFRGDVAKAKFSVLYMSKGRLAGANMINNGRELKQLRQFIVSGELLDCAIAADASRSLKEAVVLPREVHAP